MAGGEGWEIEGQAGQTTEDMSEKSRVVTEEMSGPHLCLMDGKVNEFQRVHKSEHGGL